MFQLNEFNQPIGFVVKNWQPSKQPKNASLKGDYCKLEPLNIDNHRKALFDIFADEHKTWTYTPYGPFANYQQFCDWLEGRMQHRDSIIYVIIDIKTNQVVGMASYLNINPNHGSIEMGRIHFSKALQKTVMATEAMYLMMKNVFDELGYRRYEWKCCSLNQASRNAATRLGFIFEGIFRQHMVYKNRNRDTAWFSILDTEWPELKRKFQQWLLPNNFDENGMQRCQLREI